MLPSYCSSLTHPSPILLLTHSLTLPSYCSSLTLTLPPYYSSLTPSPFPHTTPHSLPHPSPILLLTHSLTLPPYYSSLTPSPFSHTTPHSLPHPSPILLLTHSLILPPYYSSLTLGSPGKLSTITSFRLSRISTTRFSNRTGRLVMVPPSSACTCQSSLSGSALMSLGLRPPSPPPSLPHHSPSYHWTL